MGLLFLLYSQSTHKKVKNLSLKLSIPVLKEIEYGCKTDRKKIIKETDQILGVNN